MFDKRKYYSYTNDIQFEIGLTYSVCTIISVILIYLIYNVFENLIISILIFVLGIIFANIRTKKLEIKSQEMYWFLDMYDKIKNK